MKDVRIITWSIFWKATLSGVILGAIVGAIVGAILGIIAQASGGFVNGVGFTLGWQRAIQIITFACGLIGSFFCFNYFIWQTLGKNFGGKMLVLKTFENSEESA